MKEKHNSTKISEISEGISESIYQVCVFESSDCVEYLN